MHFNRVPVTVWANTPRPEFSSWHTLEALKRRLALVAVLPHLARVRRVLLYLLPFMMAASAGAQANKGKDLFEAILRMDRHLSDAFNAHSADRLMAMATNNLEFYDENGGLKDFQQCFAEFGAAFAGAANVRRELVEGTMEVYSINGYGALELGQNRLCHTENGKEECHVSKFAMLWQKENDSWKLSRIISYGQ